MDDKNIASDSNAAALLSTTIQPMDINPANEAESLNEAVLSDAALVTSPIALQDAAAEAPQTFRNVALGIIATAALIWLLKYAEDVIIPVLLGLILSYSLRPFVEWMQRRMFIPRPLAAAMLLVALFGGVGAGLWNLRADAAAVAGESPKAARMIREFIGTAKNGTSGLFNDIRRAAREIDQASAALSTDQSSERDRKVIANSATTLPGRAVGITEKYRIF